MFRKSGGSKCGTVGKNVKKANPNLQFDALIVADDRFHLKVDANCGHERRGKAALKSKITYKYKKNIYTLSIQYSTEK